MQSTNNMNMIKVVSKKLVKPCIPTPPHLKTYKLSFIDELIPQTVVGVLLFYASPPNQLELEQRLSKTLPQFYPLAGRYITTDQTIDCSDQGAELVEAEAPHLDLPTLLMERDLKNLQGLLPRKDEAPDVDYPMLSVQATKLLKCGGLVIGICVSHKILDASSLGTFITAWSEACSVNPSFIGNSVFPGKNQTHDHRDILIDPNVVVKRFTFSKNSIARLKSRLRAAGERVSRVRVVSAVIAKALIGLDRVKHGRFRDCFVLQPVDMRGRTTPPLHKHSCGNMILMATSRCIPATEAEEIDVRELVDLIGDAINESISKCSEILSLDADERKETVIGLKQAVLASYDEAHIVRFSDGSKAGFYEANFGWGKPVWVAVNQQPGENIAVLMGNKDDGIEAWVHLDKNGMALFEQDEEIGLFAN